MKRRGFMRNKFKAINTVELTEREFTFEDLRIQNDIGVLYKINTQKGDNL